MAALHVAQVVTGTTFKASWDRRRRPCEEDTRRAGTGIGVFKNAGTIACTKNTVNDANTDKLDHKYLSHKLLSVSQEML